VVVFETVLYVNSELLKFLLFSDRELDVAVFEAV